MIAGDWNWFVQCRTANNLLSSTTLKAQNQQDAQSQQGLAVWLVVSLVVVVFGFVLFLGVSCLSVVFLVGLFLWFFFVKAHPRTPFSITVHFYNTNITIFHIVSKTNIKAEKTLWREILICPDNCIITLSTAFDINFSLGDKKKIYVNLYIHSECPNSKLFRTIWSLVQN